MIIAQSQVEFSYKHQYSEKVSVKESLVTRPIDNDELPQNESASLLSQPAQPFTQGAIDDTSQYSSNEDEEPGPYADLDIETAKLKMLVEQLAGHKIKLADNSHQKNALNASNTRAELNVSAGDWQDPQTTKADLILQYEESYQEHEAGHFSANGQLVTRSGDTINLSLSQFTQRQFFIENRIEMKVGEVELTDPLVINLKSANNGGLQLTQEKIAFDIDSDGKADNIHFASGASGFVAIDTNMNGKIDDGSELFGARTGNGFAELAQYDSDGNHFIDEADPVFSKLAFYQKDLSGNDVITPLRELGVGALYLGNIAAPFDVKDANNQLQAKVRANGFFLFEDGRAGTLQQIDLAV
jgi:hypothetical protein